MLERIWDDIDILFDKNPDIGEFPSWYWEHHTWSWVLGLVLCLGMISMLFCWWMVHESKKPKDLQDPKAFPIAVCAVLSLLGIVWHVIFVTVVPAALIAAVVGMIPVGGGWLCYLRKGKA